MTTLKTGENISGLDLQSMFSSSLRNKTTQASKDKKQSYRLSEESESEYKGISSFKAIDSQHCNSPTMIQNNTNHAHDG